MSEKQKNKDKDSTPVYKSRYGDALKNNLAKVMEKKNFSYDADKDKLFSQYKNSYEKSGRTAMRDTMGNAASLTGGYGNSYAVTAGQTKVVILTVPEDFEDAPEYAGSRIVYNITMKKVEQPNVPMITDAYVQEYFSCNTVAEYRQSIKDDIQETIDEQIEDAKKEAVLTKLQQNCEITGYPEEYLSSKQSELETSIKFYALMQGLSNDEYCQKSFGISFEEYVKRAVAQDLIFQSIIEQEDLSITDYEYKGDLESFADKMGFTNKDSFVEKYGKDKIVRAMLLQKAQDVVMNSAVYE